MSGSRKCSVAGCGRAYHGVGLCQAHYMRKRRHGEPTGGVHEVGRPLTTEDRFLAKVSKDATGCWLWTGSTTSKGYGLFRHGRVMPAYRFAHIHFIGTIPEGLEVDHLCSVRACVNPEHLEAVTHSENLRRARERGRNHAN